MSQTVVEVVVEVEVEVEVRKNGNRREDSSKDALRARSERTPSVSDVTAGVVLINLT